MSNIEKFRQLHKENITKLKTISFDEDSTQNHITTINTKFNKLLTKESNQTIDIENILQTFSNENIRNIFEKESKTEIKNFINFINEKVKKIESITTNSKNVQKINLEIKNEINKNENLINEFINFYSEYKKSNKNFLIRNKLLSTFLDKINFTKEDKDNLVNKNIFNQQFFLLISKLKKIKINIEIIEKNSEKFSKNLIFSLKENFNIIDELLNEKIVLFLKQTFRTATKKNLILDDYENILSTLLYLQKNKNYLNFILKEYTQMRKKLLDEILKKKFTKIRKFEEIFNILIDDYEFYFIKEFIILFTFFFNENEIFLKNELFQILYFYNFNENENFDNKKEIIKLFEPFINKIKTQIKDFNSFTQYLNNILYVIEEIFYENINTQKNNILNSDSIVLSEIYKINILCFYTHAKLDNIFKLNNFNTNLLNEQLNLFSMINNYKKTFSKSLSKSLTDNLKNLQKYQKNYFNYLKDDNILYTNDLNKVILNISEEYSKIISLFTNYIINSNDLVNPIDQEFLSPKYHSLFKLLIDFFNVDSFDSNNYLLTIKIINLIQIIINKLQLNDDYFNNELNSLQKYYLKFEGEIVKSFIINILKSTKFEETLSSQNISHDQSILLIEHILEKSQFYFLNLNLISDFNTKENIKIKVKLEILNIYKQFLLKEENLNMKFLSEGEFRNYLEIL